MEELLSRKSDKGTALCNTKFGRRLHVLEPATLLYSMAKYSQRANIDDSTVKKKSSFTVAAWIRKTVPIYSLPKPQASKVATPQFRFPSLSFNQQLLVRRQRPSLAQFAIASASTRLPCLPVSPGTWEPSENEMVAKAEMSNTTMMNTLPIQVGRESDVDCACSSVDRPTPVSQPDTELQSGTEDGNTNPVTESSTHIAVSLEDHSAECIEETGDQELSRLVEEESHSTPREIPLDESPVEQASMETSVQLQSDGITDRARTMVFECVDPDNSAQVIHLFDPLYLVVFDYSVETINPMMRMLYRLLRQNTPFPRILANFPLSSAQHSLPSFQPTYSHELASFQFALTCSVEDQRKGCFDLLIDFVKGIEICLLEEKIPYTDASEVGFLPFVEEQLQYLPNRSYYVLQICLPHAMSGDRAVALVLLLSKLLSESVVECGLLKAMECNDQCFVLHKCATYLATDNHKLEAVVKLYPEHAVGYCVLATPAEKRLEDHVESLLNELEQQFEAKFASSSFQIVERLRHLSPNATNATRIPECRQRTTQPAPIPRVDSGIFTMPSSVETAHEETCTEIGN